MKAKQSQHTPTPWNSTHSDVNGLFRIEGISDMNCDPLIGRIYTKEDAEFIVRAVNSHEELVNALKELLKVFPDTTNQDQVNAVVKSAKALIKAEGK